MKRILSYLLVCTMCLSLFMPCVSAQNMYTLTQDVPLTIEFEDHIPEDKGHLLLTSADASGGAMMGGGWDTSGFSTITIPFTVTEDGNYDVEFVESRGIAGEGYSRIDGSIFAEDNETLVHGFNMNFYPQKDPDFVEKEYQVTTTTGWNGGFGNIMIKQKYPNLALEAGTYNIRFDIHAVGDHTNFALDYFMLTSVGGEDKSANELTMSEALTIEFEDNLPGGKEAYIVSSSDASSGKMVGSGWGATDFTNITIPLSIREAGYYDIEFVESMVDRWGSYSRIDGKLIYTDGEPLNFNNNAGPMLDPDFESKIYENFPENYMEKQKYTGIWLEAGEVNISFDLTLVGGTHTHFALDYIKFTPSAPEEEESYELTMTAPLNIEIEDNIPAGREAYVYKSVDASGGKFVGSGWGAADFNKMTIPLSIKEAGSYDIEFVESKFYAGDGYSRIDNYLADADGTMVLAFNGNHAPNIDPNYVEKEYYITDLGGFGNKMIKQKYTNIRLEEGEVNICFDIMLVGDHTNFAIDYIKFTPRTAAKIESVKIGGEEFEENKSYHRSSDVIVLDYDNELDIKVEPSVTLEEVGGADVALVCDYSEDKDKLIIKLAESLEYGKSYNLVVSGVVDTLGFKLDAKTVTFAVQSTDESVICTDTISIDSFTISKGIANIKGSIKSSMNIGIAGRKIKWYMTLPGQDKVLIKENVASGKDGTFDLSYTLPEDDVQGTVVSEIKSDYAKDETAEIYYLSNQYLLPTLQSLKTASDWQSVKNIIDTNKTILGVNPSGDLAGLVLRDYYDQYLGATFTSINDFRDFYNAMIALEKINQATNAYRVKQQLTNEAVIELLGLDGGKISALGDASDELFDVILDLERIRGKEAFKEAFDNAFNEVLMSQEGLLDTVMLVDDATAEQGEEIKLAVDLADEVKNIKKITLYATFEGSLETGVSDVSFETALGAYDIELTKNKAVIEITAEKLFEGNKIGTLKFVSDDIGTGSVKLYGVADAKTSTEYDASLALQEATVDVSVSAQKKQSIGGGGSSGVGGISFSKGDVIIPQIAEKKETSETNEIFVDLEEALWAKDYILGLYNKQAISRNEEGKFYPTRNITRAEFIKIVVLANDIVRGSLVEVNFEDVNPDDWYYQYVEAAVRVGLILGNDDGRFCPNDYITREDICVILGRLAGVNENVNVESFADDSEISNYARASVYTMKQREIVNGIGDNLFAPKAYATRAEAAKIIYGLSK